MANSTSTCTGVLVFDGKAVVTPLIQALFSPFGLDPSYPREDACYVATQGEGQSRTWEDIGFSLHQHAEALGVQAVDREDGEVDLAATLDRYARKIGADAARVAEFLASVEEAVAENLDAELAEVYQLAMLLRDGHNLSALQSETAWYCFRPRLGEFGGCGDFIGEHCSVHIASSTAAPIGVGLDLALRNPSKDAAAAAAADMLSGLLQAQLQWIRDDEIRASVRKTLAKRLQSSPG